MMIRIVLIIAVEYLVSACGGGIPTAEEAGISFPTTPAIDINHEFDWQEIGFAKELINAKEKKVLVNGGSNPIPLDEWADFNTNFPWVKNLDRNLLFQKTAFLRSPLAPEDCQGEECIDEVEYKGYTWMELAQPIAIDYIPDETDNKKPEAGHVVIKTIKKCQVIYFEDFI